MVPEPLKTRYLGMVELIQQYLIFTALNVYVLIRFFNCMYNIFVYIYSLYFYQVQRILRERFCHQSPHSNLFGVQVQYK